MAMPEEFQIDAPRGMGRQVGLEASGLLYTGAADVYGLPIKPSWRASGSRTRSTTILAWGDDPASKPATQDEEITAAGFRRDDRASAQRPHRSGDLYAILTPEERERHPMVERPFGGDVRPRSILLAETHRRMSLSGAHVRRSGTGEQRPFRSGYVNAECAEGGVV